MFALLSQLASVSVHYVRTFFPIFFALPFLSPRSATSVPRADSFCLKLNSTCLTYFLISCRQQSLLSPPDQGGAAPRLLSLPFLCMRSYVMKPVASTSASEPPHFVSFFFHFIQALHYLFHSVYLCISRTQSNNMLPSAPVP
jgi:hypothetical protein